MHRKAAPLIAISLFALLAASAEADVGVEKASRKAGEPGDTVTVTLGCGFCYPPCKGPRGERQPTPCMLGTKGRRPPASFGISLVPIGKMPAPYRCGPKAFCAPEASAPPRRAPFRYLGQAAALNDITQETGRVPVPRYVLDFTIPNLRPGTYTYVIYCDVCVNSPKGDRGSLITGGLDPDHMPRNYLLEVRARGAARPSAASSSRSRAGSLCP